MTRAKSSSGVLIALEGIDGAGKSTLAGVLARELRGLGYSVQVVREPHDPAIGKEALRVTAEDPMRAATLFTLDRLLARASLTSDLKNHQIVLSDRSFYSTLAYQGSLLSPQARGRLELVQREVTVVPDRVVWIDIAPEVALRRLRSRGGRRAPVERAVFLRRVRAAYRRLGTRPRWLPVDGGRPADELSSDIVKRLRPWLRRRLRPPDR